jgi:hypothetical protein
MRAFNHSLSSRVNGGPARSTRSHRFLNEAADRRNQVTFKEAILALRTELFALMGQDPSSGARLSKLSQV